MQLTLLHRWHWIVISLIVGWAAQVLYTAWEADPTGDYVQGFGYLLADQERFETALMQQIQGHRAFEQITVYPRYVDNPRGGRDRVYVVAGSYWDGITHVVGGVPREIIFRPTCFIARVPYKPALDLSAYSPPGGLDLSKRFNARGPRPTVLDFLQVMHDGYGVDFQYAWWDAHPALTCFTASFVLLGLIVPTLVNLLFFGSFTRPQSAPALSLWRYKPRREEPITPIPTSHASASRTDDLLEQALHQPAGDSAPAAHAPELDTQPLAPAAPVATTDPAEFRARQDDYYPTHRVKPGKKQD